MAAATFRTRAANAVRSRANLVALGALLAGCSSLLGIEDLSTEPRDGAADGGTSAQAGKGGSGGSGGANGGSAGTPGGRNGSGGGTGAKGGTGETTGGAGGSAGAGADSGGKGGSSGTSGGSAGRGGTGTSGDGSGPGGEGGMVNPPDPTVRGTIVDFWGHPLPNLPVAIGDEQTVTDDNGEFTVEDVPDEYDVSFIVHWSNPASNYGWVFQGLTRRNPTLQVYRGLNDRYSNFNIAQKNGNFTTSSLWLVAFGSADGSYVSSHGENGSSYVQPTWTGGSTNEWSVHSLFFERTNKVPTKYTAHESQVVLVTDGDGGHDVEMDLTLQDLDSGTISGSVIQKTGVGRVNSVFVRFTSGAVLPVVDAVDTSAAPYSYVVPQLPNSTLTVAAIESDYNTDTFALAHRDKRTVDDAGVDLQIPAHATPVTPAMGSQNVNGSTQFAFTGSDSDNSGYLVHIEDSQYRQGMYIVTAKKSFKLADVPVVNGGFMLMPAEPHWWVVETHGKFASTDDMTGSNGYLDEFAWDESRPKGPAHHDGSYTRSAAYGFTTAP